MNPPSTLTTNPSTRPSPESVEALETRLSEPSAALLEDIRSMEGDLMILGAGGKMGPTLCRMARQALDRVGKKSVQVHAVSRFSDSSVAEELIRHGVKVIEADLTREEALDHLPDAHNVIFMVGAKFGSSIEPAITWHTNTTLPAQTARRFASSSIVALSTGNVYPMVSPIHGASTEDDDVEPIGEYAMSCVGRERSFQYAAIHQGTRVAVVRLNYAVDLRYGILVDLANTMMQGDPVDLTTPAVNLVWQRYANEAILRCLPHASSPPFVVNVTGPETTSVRRLATMLAERLDMAVRFSGEPASTALLSDASRCHQMFGYPDISLLTLVDWQAEWIRGGLPLSGKPTKFGVRDGAF